MADITTYGLTPLTVDTVIPVLLFFPVIYGITELIDKLTPTPGEEAAQTTPVYIPVQTTPAPVQGQPAAPMTSPGVEVEEKRPDYTA